MNRMMQNFNLLKVRMYIVVLVILSLILPLSGLQAQINTKEVVDSIARIGSDTVLDSSISSLRANNGNLDSINTFKIQAPSIDLESDESGILKNGLLFIIIFFVVIYAGFKLVSAHLKGTRFK